MIWQKRKELEKMGTRKSDENTVSTKFLIFKIVRNFHLVIKLRMRTWSFRDFMVVDARCVYLLWKISKIQLVLTNSNPIIILNLNRFGLVVGCKESPIKRLGNCRKTMVSKNPVAEIDTLDRWPSQTGPISSRWRDEVSFDLCNALR